MAKLNLAELIAAKKKQAELGNSSPAEPAKQATQQAKKLTPIEKIMLAKKQDAAPANTKPAAQSQPTSPLLAKLLKLNKDKQSNDTYNDNGNTNTNSTDANTSRPSISHNSNTDNVPATLPISAEDSNSNVQSPTGMHGERIKYNKEQQQAVDLGSAGNSFVLIGAAGTGKTTCSQGVISSLIASGKIPVLDAEDHSHLRSGSLGILIIAFTRRAVNNSRKVQSEDFKHNCITAHKLLEYSPVYNEIEDPETGLTRRTMSFEPNRNEMNPIPSTVHTIIVEEASMLSVELFKQIQNACQHKVQWIFIGDLEQLPPVFGSAILGFALLELPVVQLTQVYRQALESPIIRLAHRVLSGNPIPVEEYTDWKIPNELTIHPWKKKLHPDLAVATLAAFFKAAIDKDQYDPEEDTILIPYNKACGTLELNANIANHLARKRGVETYEIIAGFAKYYYSVGDKVLYDKEDAEILHIEPNLKYMGKPAQPASVHLDYWGHNPNLVNERTGSTPETALDGVDVDSLLGSLASESPDDRVTKSSHIVTVRLLDSDTTRVLDKASEINSMLHSYALTVHKAQGSEWRKVFLCLHQSHATALQRELLYTAVTRAREELYVICEPESFTKGILSQRIKGNTLEDKAEHFKGKTSGYEGKIFTEDNSTITPQ